MTRHPTEEKLHANGGVHGVVEAGAHEDIESAINAVCGELGLNHRSDERRLRVAHGVLSTWRSGRRLPLNLVKAGLDAGGA